ncbi:MAG TPA: alpha/beta hydrolase [Verrucomicrobiae bacterium]|nr:alpha/beta hydrolase [Verrucomicrobiae bacterium]
MKTLNQIKILWLIAGCALICGPASNLNAQDTNMDWGTASDDQVILQAIELTTPTPSNEVPGFDTFYSAQHSPISSQPWPPLPANMNDFNAWNLGSNIWVLDDLGFDYNALSAEADQSMAMDDDSGINPPGSGGTNIYFPAGSSYSFDPGTNLWIAQEAVSGGNFTGILSNTIAGVEYQLLSMNSLNSGQWAYQGEPLLAYTNWVAWSLPFDPRTNFFLNALSFQDDTGTGIPDWWLLKYFGQDTNVDPYADPVGDGWTLLQDFQNGLSPTNFETPPAPEGLAVTSYNSVSNWATLTWLPSSGAVTNYTLQTPSGNVNISASSDSYEDQSSSPYATYMVQANYAGGNSAWSAEATVPANQNTLSANIIGGPLGSAYLAVSDMPTNTASLQLSFIDYFSGMQTNLVIPVSDPTNGFYSVPNFWLPVLNYFDYWLATATDTNGNPVSSSVVVGAGYMSLENFFSTRWVVPPYFDGRAAMKQNLIFLLRAANESSPIEFEYAPPWAEPYQSLYSYPTNYVYEGFYYTLYPYDFDIFEPFEENYIYRNFAFSSTNVDSSGEITSGPTGDSFPIGMNEPPTYQFIAPDTNGALIPAVLSTSDTEWLCSYPPDANDYSEMGIGEWFDNQYNLYFSMTNDVPNYFGLPFASAAIAWGSGNDNYTVLNASSTVENVNGYFYPATASPKFQTLEYDFWSNPGAVSLPYAESADTTNVPGTSGFSTSYTNSLMIASVGDSSFQVVCYAKLAVTNSIYSDVYAYLGQYFTNAYQIDSTGNVTTNLAGMLSPYGAFFPTQPGPAALETMPDIDTGQQGTGVVYCISLQVDKNHDGVMDTNFFGADTTSQSSPMEFWLNNDNDGTGVGEEIDAPTLPDSDNDVIQSMRGLEDFARLWICGLPALPYDYQVTLSWANISSGNPSIKIFPSQETNGGTEYLTDTNVAQNYVDNPLTEPCFGTVTNGQNFQFPNLYFTEGGDKHLIFEGVTAGAGELMLTVTDNNGNTIGQTGVWLDLHDIQDFYELAEATNVTSGLPPSSSISQINVVRAVPPAQNETKQIIVFVHGINNTAFDAQSSTETLYKRLYWSGYHGKVAEFKWPCAFLPFDNTLNPFNYNLGEFYAWKSAAALVDYLTYLRNRPDLAGYDIDILAHSQGNVVASEAVRLGAPFDNYILTQGAIPAHCYDTSVPFLQSLLDAESNSPTPFYTTNGGYNGYFSGVTGNLVNFYNTNDYALATGTWNGLQANWVADQISQKPEDYTYRGGQSYAYYPSSFRTIASYTFSDYDVTDPYEILSQVARSRSSAVGAQANVAGVIDSAASVDLVAEFGFGNTRPEHSAEFTRPIQSVWGYYDAVLTAFKLQHVAR